MNRREFLRNLAIGVAGLYVPKTLYFDMGKNLVRLPNQELIDLVKRIEGHSTSWDVMVELHNMKLNGTIKHFSLDPIGGDSTIYIMPTKSLELIAIEKKLDDGIGRLSKVTLL